MKAPALHALRLLFSGACLVVFLFENRADGGIQYWDPLGNTPTPTPDGTWEGNFWASSSTLTGTLTTFTEGNLPVFAAGTAATGTYTVTAMANHTIGGLFNGSIGTAARSTNLIINGAAGVTFSIANGFQGFATASGGQTFINVPLGGSGTLTSEGSGQLFLFATNTYTGGTSLGFSGNPFTGILNFNNSNSFGTGTVSVSNTGGVICGLVGPPSDAVTITNAWKIWTTNGGINIVGNPSGLTFTGTWGLTNSLNIGAGVSGNFVILSGVISGSGGVNKFNPATLRLSGANSYTNSTTVSNGTLQLGVGGAIPSGPGKGNLIVTSPGLVDVNGVSASVNGLSGTGTIDNTTGIGTLSVGNNNVSSTFNGGIQNSSGVLNLIKAGTGTFTLNTALNSYSGETTVTAGTLLSGADNAIPGGSAVVLMSAGTLNLAGHADTIASLNGGGVLTNCSGTLTVGGSLSSSNFNAYSCFFGPINGGGTVIKSGSHAMALRQTNMYGVNFVFNDGVLSVGAGPNRLPPTYSLVVPGSGLFQLDANNQTVASLGGGGSLNLSGGTLTVTGNSFYSGIIQDCELSGSFPANGHGLRGYYYDNNDFTGLVAVRDDATINFTNLNLPTNLPTPPYPNTNQFSIRWLGQVLTTVAGNYTFTTTSDDGQRLWVNGTNLVDNWGSQGATAKSGLISLAANTRYDIIMEYMNIIGSASTKLAWTPPGDSVSSVIPTEFLFLPGRGKLVFNGTGQLTLAGSNSFTGGTIVNGGTLSAESDGALGRGNVFVSDGATLSMDSGVTNGYLANSADLLMTGATSLLNLNFSGTNSIHAFSTNGGTSYRPAGTYGAIGSGATFQSSRIIGNGILNVTAIPSSIGVMTSGSPSPYGNSVTFTSAVTGSGPVPTGMVTFYDGASAIGTRTLDGTGHATLTVSNLQVMTSPHFVTAVYGGDAVYIQSTSTPIMQSVSAVVVVPGTLVVSNKVYDGTVNGFVAASSTLVGVLPADTNSVHIGSGTVTFSDKNVGVGKAVSLTNLTLTGGLAGNYSLMPNGGSSTANITAAGLAITNVTANNRVYNGTTNATLNTGTAALVGVIAGDSVTLDSTSATGSFATPAPGINKAVTTSGFTLTGLDAGNYILTYPSTTATITQAGTTNALISSANPSAPGATVTFTSTPIPISPGAGVPSGSVIFLTNNFPLSTNNLSSGSATSAGTTNLSVGTNTVTALYAGDVNFIGSTNSMQQVVGAVGPPALSITLAGTNIVLNWTGSFTLQSSSHVSNTNSGFSDVMPGPVQTGPYTNGVSGTSKYFRLRN